jgi:hypothetical protein
MSDRMFKYVFYKCKFFFVKYYYQRDPLKSKFNITIKDIKITGDKEDLINFVKDKFPLKMIKVSILHNFAIKNDLYKMKSSKDVSASLNQHMYITINSDLQYPIIILFNMDGEISYILDGLHRIKKAHILGKKHIKSYIVPENEILNLKVVNDEKLQSPQGLRK